MSFTRQNQVMYIELLRAGRREGRRQRGRAQQPTPGFGTGRQIESRWRDPPWGVPPPRCVCVCSSYAVLPTRGHAANSKHPC